MKSLFIVFSVVTLFFSCKQQVVNKQEELKTTYAAFGDRISSEKALQPEVLLEKFRNLKVGDTIETKVKATIIEICQNKGCWLTLDLGSNEKAFVKFKEYGFFVPMNAQKRTAILEGKAFVEETSVSELKHYAEDEGKTEAEIAKITSPKTEFKFIANGVLIAK
jgi:hypothetical protein